MFWGDGNFLLLYIHICKTILTRECYGVDCVWWYNETGIAELKNNCPKLVWINEGLVILFYLIRMLLKAFLIKRFEIYGIGYASSGPPTS